MSVTIVVWLLLALVFFWIYGLNSRLVRMRSRAQDAMGSMEKHMRHYATLVVPHTQGKEELSPRWQRLMDMLETLDAELKDARNLPLTDVTLRRLWRAYENVQAAWSSLLKSRTSIGANGIPLPDNVRTEWDENTFRVLSARSGVNGILTNYNEALQQVPACWVARLLGHGRLGQLA